MTDRRLRALLIDLDGVIYRGDQPIEGTVEAVRWLAERKVPHLFVTNTTSRPRAAIVDKLAGMGIDVEADRILTPPVAAVRHLVGEGRRRVALFVPEATRADFGALESIADDAEEGAEAVVVGDLGEGWDFATLNRAFRLLMAEPAPALVALGMTRYFRGPDGKLRLDAAPFVTALFHASGVEPTVVGKPAEAFFQTALAVLDAERSDVAMIGDDVRGDVGGAQAAGLRGVLVRTGKFRDSDLEGDVRPDAVLPSIADLPAWWGSRRT